MFDGLRLLLEGALASPWLLLVILGLAVVDALVPMVPSEALIIAAGVGAAAGDQSLVAVIGAASLGSFVGECTAFALGRGFGASVRGRLAPGGPRAELFARVERTLATRGGLILLTARYIPAGRTVAALAGGGGAASRSAGTWGSARSGPRCRLRTSRSWGSSAARRWPTTRSSRLR